VPAKVYFFPHPFTSERREETIESGATLESIVKNARNDIPHGLMVRTYVNGKLISNNDRSKTIVHDDDEIIVRIVPENGSEDTDRGKAANTKAFGGAIASLALIAVGIVTGGVAWVAAGFAIGIASPFLAGLTGAGVIGGPYADEMGTINHPSIHGAQNQSNPNGKVPLVFGKHLMTPGYLSPPYTEISGVDGQDQYLHMAFILGYTPLKVSNIQFGDMLIATNSANVTNGTIVCDGVLPGCEAEIRQDSVNGTGLSLYPKEVIEQNLSAALARYHVLESTKELNGITITVNAAARTFTRSSGDWTATGTKDTTSYADIRVGDFITFSGFSNAGNNKQCLVTGVSPTTIYCNQATGLVNEAKSGIHARCIVVPSNIQTTAKNTTKIAVTITFPKLVKYSNNDKLNATVMVKPYYRLKSAPGATPNPWTLLGTFDNGSNTITRNKAETLRFVATSATLTAGQYEVFVARETEDATDSNIQDVVFWTSLQSFTDLDIMPVNTRKKVAILGIKIKSSEAVQNCITKLNCIVSADYSYITEKDTGHDWASIIATDPQNTALAFVHALMGAGNPRPRTAAQIDWNSVYAFAQWCNTLKGLSGSQYRIETNGIVTQGAKLSELIAQILSPARASLTMSDGTYGVVWDALQTTPKQHIGPHNSWGFRGTKSFGEVVHGYRIKFINSNEQYVIDERIVLDDGYKYDTEQDGVLRDAWGVDRTSDSSYTEATKFESIEAVYMTNPAQVFGFGRYLLATRRLRPEMFTVNMDAENLAVKRGELVKVSHPAPRWGLADGRLTGLTTDEYGDILAVETDNAVFMESGKSYAIRFRTSSGASIYWPVATVAGDTHTLTFSSGMPVNDDMPAVGDMFFFGIAGLETIDCIVFGIDLNDDLSAKLTLFEAAPAVHNADAGAIPEFNSKVSFGPKASAPSTVTPVYPPSQDVIPYPATKALATLSAPVDFNGQYGIYQGIIYIGTMPNTWVRDYAGQTAAEVASIASDYADDAKDYAETLASALQTQVDRAIVYYTQAGDPSIDWTTTALKNEHIGDYWRTATGAVWKQWSGTAWTEISDPVAQACATAAAGAADAAQGTANSAVTAAANAQTTANNAASSATIANNLLADIASDSKLTPVEKSSARSEWNIIAAELTANDAQATAFGITTEKTAYDNAFQALATYLNAGTTWTSGIPSWLADANLGTTTDIVGATFRATWKAYYDARTALLNAIAAKAKTLADAAQGTANAKTTVWATLALAQASAKIGDLFLDASLLYRCTVAGASITLANSTRLTPKRYADVANTTARNALTGMIFGDSVYQTDTRQWYIYTTSWVADGLPQLSEDDVEEMIPRCLGLFAYASRGSIAGMHENDLAVLYSTVWAERGIYAYIGTTWTKQPSPTANQVSLCFVYVLDAVRQGYGVSADYIGTGATSFETLLVRFLFAQNIVLGTTGYIKSSNFATDPTGFPSAGFRLAHSTGVLEAVGAKLDIAEVRGVKWSSPVQLGSGLTISGAGSAALAALNSTDVAFIDRDNDSLRVYRWNGSTWAQVGSGLSISGIGYPALAALNGTDVAFIDGVNASLRVYRWDGSTWTQVGSGLTISGAGTPALAALSSTDVAFIDSGNDSIRVYRWNGSSWAQVGSGLTITGVGYPALAALNSTDVAFIDSYIESLKVYRWNGSSWAQVGSGLTITGVGQVALTALNSTDVAFIDRSNDSIRVYRWNGSSWAQVGSAGSISLSGGIPALAAMNGTDVAFIDSYNKSLKMYRFGFSLATPYHP